MTEFIPYFAALVTILFCCGFALAIIDLNRNDSFVKED